MNYRDFYNTKQTPQSSPIPRRELQMVRNRARGYAFSIGEWKQLERFLIIGTAEPTYYADAREMTVENAKAVIRCINEDGKRAVDTIVRISEEGRAPKNDPALFALAMACADAFAETRKYAFNNLHRVARTGTHLFHFVHFMEGFRGWGRLPKEAISYWYNAKSVDSLAFQMLKYKQRDGWSHKDLLRLAHVRTANAEKNNLYAWAVGKEYNRNKIPALVNAYREIHEDQDISVNDAVLLINEYRLSRGMLPTGLLNEPRIWEALIPEIGMEELLRNLGKMGSIGFLDPFSSGSHAVIEKLSDREEIAKSRLHPIAVLKALHVYKQGSGIKGSLSWASNSRIIDALDQTFYHSFKNVESTGKRHMIALDISGSMGWNYIDQLQGMSAREVSAAMSLVTAKTEPESMFVGFSHTLITLDISSRQRLDDVIRRISNLPYGGTDASLPILYAMKKQIPVDVFVVYTDNESWAGSIHPSQALVDYRNNMGIDAKLISVAMTATNYSIADPLDRGMLDVVGFDSAAPAIMSKFANGEI